jgi:hypothetical protein
MHRFKVGDTVTYNPGTKHVGVDGAYEIVAAMPREDNVDEYLYRIKSIKEATIRVAPEGQLKPYE